MIRWSISMCVCSQMNNGSTGTLVISFSAITKKVIVMTHYGFLGCCLLPSGRRLWNDSQLRVPMMYCMLFLGSWLVYIFVAVKNVVLLGALSIHIFDSKAPLNRWAGGYCAQRGRLTLNVVHRMQSMVIWWAFLSFSYAFICLMGSKQWLVCNQWGLSIGWRHQWCGWQNSRRILPPRFPVQRYLFVGW